MEKVGALKPHLGPEPFTIVELGAGTGKFTRAVLKVFEKHAVKNFKIIATEPLKEMCEKFKEMVPNVEILQCPASDLDGMYFTVPLCINSAIPAHFTIPKSQCPSHVITEYMPQNRNFTEGQFNLSHTHFFQRPHPISYLCCYGWVT